MKTCLWEPSVSCTTSPCRPPLLSIHIQQGLVVSRIRWSMLRVWRCATLNRNVPKVEFIMLTMEVRVMASVTLLVAQIKNERSPQRQNPWEFLLNMLILIHRCTNGITSPLPWAHHWSVGHWTPQSGRRVLVCVWCCSSLGSPPPYIPSGRSCCTGSDQWRLSEAERVAQSQSSCVWKKNYNFNIKI